MHNNSAAYMNSICKLLFKNLIRHVWISIPEK